MGYFGHIIGMAITLKCLKNFFSQSGEKNDFWHPLNPSGSKILKSLQKPWKNAWKGLKIWNKIPEKKIAWRLCGNVSWSHHFTTWERAPHFLWTNQMRQGKKLQEAVASWGLEDNPSDNPKKHMPCEGISNWIAHDNSPPSVPRGHTCLLGSLQR